MDSQTLIDAIVSRQWPIIVAIVVMLIAAFVGDAVVRARIGGLPLRVTSIVRAYVAGAGAAVIAGAVWWQALIAGAFAPIVSAGARDLLVDLLVWLRDQRKAGGAPAPPAALSLLLILPVLGLSGGCAAWQEPGPEGACETEAAIVDALEAASVSIASIDAVPDEVKIELREALAVGRALVRSCEAVRDREGWQAWVAIGLRIAEVVVGCISRARAKADLVDGLSAPLVPPDLDEVVGLLRAEAT